MSPKKKNKMTKNTKKWIFIIIFAFLGFATLFGEKESTIGFYLSKWLFVTFGEYYKWIFAPVLILLSGFMIHKKEANFDMTRLGGLMIFYISVSTMIGFFQDGYNSYLNLYPIVLDFLGKSMTFLVFFVLFLISLVTIFDFSPVNFLNHLFKVPAKIGEIKDTFVGDGIKIPKRDEKINYKKLKQESKKEEEKRKLKEEMERLKEEKYRLEKEKAMEKQSKINFRDKDDAPKKIEIEEKKFSLFSKNKENNNEKTVIKLNRKDNFSNWIFPELSLLNDKSKNQVSVDKNEIRRKELEIQEKLLQFKIEVEMQGYQVGPTVIQYRLKPKDGIKLQKIVNLKDDLALALHAKSIRIQAPIPGLGVVGVEVPNPKREAVYLKEVLGSAEFNNKKFEIPLSIGKDVSGNTIVGDLADMPHLLVAGQTKSGKSVGMNGFIMSMLYRFSPSELRMIMIDPKMVELSVYNGIPHLLTPVITNADKALNSLKWSVAEMLRRYQLASKVNAKNLIEYNQKVEKDEKFHYIIIIIDELADLMMSGNKKEIEDNISRVAQMGRAVGMHLIIATQRPSVNVLTGLIKANVPSRIAFTVASQIDSRTVLDQGGAEELLGKGDMLYYPTGAVEPVRVQGVLVETSEVEAVVNQLKLTVDPDANLMIPEIADGKSKFEGSIMEGYSGDLDEDEEIIKKAIEILRAEKKGSTSLLQRKLQLGYARAAKVLDILEDMGIVGPSNGSKPREVYLD
ncbi:hypothetical protein BKN14_01380 [Candidatus Gracilibacteria bacterium HOT-871]|nr:hypothetical protein BKN14_01380 [Candidatus Gracilibacteria bacterium HOT-871]